MALRLSSADVSRLEQANTVLLSPLAYEDGDSWRRAAARAVEVCVGGEGSSFALPIPGETLIAATPEISATLQSGLLAPPEWIVRGLTAWCRQFGRGVTDWDELYGADAVRKTPFYNEVVRPQGLLAPLVMLRDTHPGSIPAALSVYFPNESAAQRHLSRRKDLLRLLYPAFSAGLEILLTFRRHYAALSALAEDAPVGVLLFDHRGGLTHENVFFQQLMSCEPGRERVRAEAARVVRDIMRAPTIAAFSTELRRGHLKVDTDSAHYRIAATLLDDVASHGSIRAVALVDKVDAKAVDARELAARFSFTKREIETAQLLRHGLSSKQIAAHLGISVNTARRHIERILLKLDVHNRTAAVAKLSGRCELSVARG